METLHYSVLLVEDHRALAGTIADYLEAIGYLVDHAPDGRNALELARAHA